MITNIDTDYCAVTLYIFISFHEARLQLHNNLQKIIFNLLIHFKHCFTYYCIYYSKYHEFYVTFTKILSLRTSKLAVYSVQFQF